MKASELVDMLQVRIDAVGDLDVEIIKSEGGFTSCSRPIVSVSTDGECTIYLEYRNIKCPVCDLVWGTTDNTRDKSLQVCPACEKFVEDADPEAEYRTNAKPIIQVEALNPPIDTPKIDKPKGKYLPPLAGRKTVEQRLQEQWEKDQHERYLYGTRGRKGTNEDGK